jgi:hypothetical protein
MHKRFSADTIKHTIAALTKELSLKHPGFYRYHSKEKFSSYIDSIKATITDSLTEMAAYLKLKPIIAKIGCLHTGIVLPEKYNTYLNTRANLLPFQVYFEGKRAFVVKNYSTIPAILPRDEILSINGKPVSEIVTGLLPLIPSDGYNLTMKYRALLYSFPLWYRNVDPAESFTLLVKQSTGTNGYTLPGATFDDLSRNGFLKEPEPAKQLEFRIENNTGILTIHTFAQSAIKACGQNFKTFIDETFASLKQQQIQNLVVDLRDNTGGSDENAVYFTRHFFDKPFRYWDRIEVTDAIAKEIKGPMTRMFYRKPVQKDSTWLWQKAKTVKDFDFYEEQKPAKNSFHGKTYLLINGFCMSSCSDAIAILSHNSKCICIGEETGGGYQGNTSGIIPKTMVTPFSFSIGVPLQKYVNHVDPSKNKGRGTLPDQPVSIGPDELIKGEDRELSYTLELIMQQTKK